MQTDHDLLQLTSRFINGTSRNVFLTGKAGTGKTTFLRSIVKTTHKKVVVAAPTGIAAINAGGVTLHSLFQLPFGVFVPTTEPITSDFIAQKVTTPRTIFKEMKMGAVKRQLIREMELLIIDEVSMLRADTLDAIDATLRGIRRQRNRQFGGVQVLFIGDMQQLPPVVLNSEKPLLDQFYPSPYFFDAKVFATEKPIYIELEHIYRQTDRDFIELLNHIRDNILTESDMAKLNAYYKPNFNPDKAQGYVNLTTHNHLADQINQQELAKLKGKQFQFEAQVDGTFEESAFPVDFTLRLKKDAQIMFIKNDYGATPPRYFNGKIGKVESLDDDSIMVAFDDGSEPVQVEPYTWSNKRYTLNKTTNEIEEKEIGTFTHYPLKLAWAITIHKSQGLTFQKAIIDVSRAFAPGQIYVALSRLVSLKGLVLTSNIPPEGLFTDTALSQFAQSKDSTSQLPAILQQESHAYVGEFLNNAFNLKALVATLHDHIDTYDKDENRSAKQNHKQWAIDLKNEVDQYAEIATKFQRQLQGMMPKDSGTPFGDVLLRVQAAVKYFEPLLIATTEKINQHIGNIKTEYGIKTYITELNSLASEVYSRRALMQKSLALVESIINNHELTRDKITPPQPVKGTAKATPRSKEPKPKTPKKPKKPKEANTFEITLELAQQGHSIEEIAVARGYATSTITSHIVKLIGEGKLDRSKYIDPTKYEQIILATAESDNILFSHLKQRLGDGFTYDEIRIALAGRTKKEQP